MNKLNINFKNAFENENNKYFSFLLKTNGLPNSEQVKQLKSLGCNYIISEIFSAHRIDRETVQKIINLDFVKYLDLSSALHPEVSP